MLLGYGSDITDCCCISLCVILWCLKLAAMRVKLIQLKDEMEDSVEKQDFQRAAELKQNITELEVSRQSLISEAEPHTTEVRTEKVGIIVVIVCLTYCSTVNCLYFCFWTRKVGPKMLL